MRFAFLFFLSLCHWTLPVERGFAAQWGRVNSDDAEVYDGPKSTHQTIRKVRRGEMVQASNNPTAGHYKVRLRDGNIGWIFGGALLLRGPKESDPPPIEDVIKPKTVPVVEAVPTQEEKAESEPPLPSLSGEGSVKSKKETSRSEEDVVLDDDVLDPKDPPNLEGSSSFSDSSGDDTSKSDKAGRKWKKPKPPKERLMEDSNPSGLPDL